ncbi:mechanosensitive ion channel family protein [Bacteriovoracaceae bacterium]|nr:mechanosensitive ion channel family protein [Bacteriovoracaceae bacterium]
MNLTNFLKSWNEQVGSLNNYIYKDLFVDIIILLSIVFTLLVIRSLIGRLIKILELETDLISALTKWPIFIIIFGIVVNRFLLLSRDLPLIGIIPINILFSFLVIGFTLGSYRLFRYLSLVFNRPFFLGDKIHIKEYTGRVKSLGYFKSTLVLEDGNQVFIPTKDIYNHPVTLIQSKNYAQCELEIKLKDEKKNDETLNLIREKILTLPMAIDENSLNLKINNETLVIKYQIWPANIHGQSESSIKKLVSNI